MKIAPGIHRLGDRSIVNSYLVEDSGEVTIIDAGVPAGRTDPRVPRDGGVSGSKLSASFTLDGCIAASGTSPDLTVGH
jgi:hypothetical protein